MRTRSVFDVRVVRNLPGILIFEISDQVKIFKKEVGGHRWQRVPPTEKRGRVHTSSVTVAVLDSVANTAVALDERELSYRTYKASGKGGQHRNKVESAVEITHLPTGIKVQCESERKQGENKRLALELLKQKVAEHQEKKQHAKRSQTRREQVGTGLRGDKIQTVQEQNGQVVNHVNGKKVSLKKYLKGRIDLLHEDR